MNRWVGMCTGRHGIMYERRTAARVFERIKLWAYCWKTEYAGIPCEETWLWQTTNTSNKLALSCQSWETSGQSWQTVWMKWVRSTKKHTDRTKQATIGDAYRVASATVWIGLVSMRSLWNDLTQQRNKLCRGWITAVALECSGDRSSIKLRLKRRVKHNVLNTSRDRSSLVTKQLVR